MLRSLRRASFRLLKSCGIERLLASSSWRQRRLLILCYHGVSIADEDQWRRELYTSQTALADRFQLRLHRETKELPVYTLSVAKNGAKFREATADDQHTTAAGPGEITDHGVAIPIFIKQLSGLVDRAVVDQTGLKGSYDLNLQWTREQDTGPSLFTALEEQLGLKLSGGKGPVEILVIDHVVRVPIEN